MKKLLSVLLITALCAALAFAQELKLGGEAKTGVLWEEGQDAGKPKDLSKVRLNSKDDAGSQYGRYRLNMDYDNGKNLGMKARINWENWGDPAPDWSYAFGYGNFFDDKLTVSVGKLGSSPWGTGGPEMWKEMEVSRYGGMRVEWKPGFVPEEAGKFNVGFILNYFDDPDEASITREATLTDILQETVFGFSWNHENLGLLRLAYRLDSERDSKQRMDGKKEGGKFLYRIEEHMLKRVAQGLQVWALGYLVGVGASEAQFYDFQNWMFIEYSPPELGNLVTPFTAQVRLGYDYVENRQVFHVKPSLYWHFTIGEHAKLISAGGSFWYGQDFGDGKVYDGSPYLFIEAAPKIQLNFSSSYIAFEYNFRRNYKGWYAEADAAGEEPIRQTQWMNLRFCIYY